MTRNDKRTANQPRPLNIIPNFMPNAAGSCLIETGRTRVLCTATVQKSVPPFLQDSGKGWLTAEYSMLPGSTITRKSRERQKSDSRSIEIQRLIGRSLRSVVDTSLMPGITITIDCDVIQADGGTRTASITGGFVALGLAVQKLLKNGTLSENPIKKYLAAISAGIVDGTPLLDLCYTEDSSAEADMNYVGTDDGEIAEIQISGEKRTITGDEFVKLVALCKKGVEEHIAYQREILETAE
ncbi:MAG: ribonuclease PH [Christensenellaceae bacterium]|nr:ribonuclease PH [Christensenellaceae bacterium]